MALDPQDTFADPYDISRWATATPEYEHFFAAVRSNDLAAVEASLEQDIDVNLLQGKILRGTAALHIASSYGYLEIVKLLLSRGAEVDVQDSDYEGSRSPLHSAACAAQTSVLQVLLDHGADVTKWSPEGNTPLLEVL